MYLHCSIFAGVRYRYLWWNMVFVRACDLIRSNVLLATTQRNRENCWTIRVYLWASSITINDKYNGVDENSLYWNHSNGLKRNEKFTYECSCTCAPHSLNFIQSIRLCKFINNYSVDLIQFSDEPFLNIKRKRQIYLE